MDWTEIVVSVPVEDIDKAGDITQMVVPYGIYIEDYSMLEQEVLEIANIDLIDEDLLKMDRTKAKVHVYISPEESPAEAMAFLSERLNSEGINHEIYSSSCVEEDWLNNWKQYFNPIAVGERLLIRPTWRDKYDAGDRVVLNLDPGLAFGTGTHETTRLCLETIERYIKPGDKMLDVGCGSGILSVAGILLGAHSALGVDIDEMAVKTANENARLNNVEDRFTAICGNLTDKVSGTYDIVVANIVADAIMALSAGVSSFMTKDTVYITSGIIESRTDEVKRALSERFEMIEELTEKGWYCIVFKLKS